MPYLIHLLDFSQEQGGVFVWEEGGFAGTRRGISNVEIECTM